MFGPVIPIYGIGALLITIFLQKYENDFFFCFFMTIIISGILEYIISYAMEKIFKLRWWDYSKNKYNINGRVCLGNLSAFGILGLIAIKYLNPFLFNFFDYLSKEIALLIIFIIACFFIVDYIVSFIITYNLKIITKNIYKDSTEEIKKQIKQNIFGNKSLYIRIIKAFIK